MGGGFEEQATEGRCPGKGSGVPTMGPERKVAGSVSCGAGHDEQQSALVAAAGVCVLEPASRSLCICAAAAEPGASERQAAILGGTGRIDTDSDDRACGG